MESASLLDYIKQAREFGLSSREILDSLISAGWKFEAVFEALSDGRIEGYEEVLAVKRVNGMIVVESLSKSFGDVQALKDVSFSVKKGTITALLGPNGAGKTTLIRILTTLLEPDSGRALVNSFDVVRNPNGIRSNLGLAGQSVALDEILTGRENLELVARLYHLSKEEAENRASNLLNQFDLTDAADRPVRTYSGGMRRRLDLAASLIANPAVLFLDEPTTGLDPRGRASLWKIIKGLANQGTTILLTTQYLDEADHLSSWIIVIDHGRIIAQGTAGDLKKQVGGDVIEIHLADHQDGLHAIKAVEGMAEKWPNFDSENGKISFPAKSGTGDLIDAIRRLDDAEIKMADIFLRRPTLDDVFLALTGHAAEEYRI